MKILVFDTCLDKMYVTLADDDKILTSKIVTNKDNKYHSAFLISTIKEVLKENNLRPEDIDAIGTNIGPGSFTGIRACTTVARMMAQQFQTSPEQLEKLVLSTGQTKEAMVKEWTGDAEKMLKSRIIVESLFKTRNITVTPEEVEAEYEKIAQEAGISVEEVKKHYADPRTKEYLIDDIKEQKLYKELFAEVKVTDGEKVSFEDLFKR